MKSMQRRRIAKSVSKKLHNLIIISRNLMNVIVISISVRLYRWWCCFVILFRVNEKKKKQTNRWLIFSIIISSGGRGTPNSTFLCIWFTNLIEKNLVWALARVSVRALAAIETAQLLTEVLDMSMSNQFSGLMMMNIWTWYFAPHYRIVRTAQKLNARKRTTKKKLN